MWVYVGLTPRPSPRASLGNRPARPHGRLPRWPHLRNHGRRPRFRASFPTQEARKPLGNPRHWESPSPPLRATGFRPVRGHGSGAGSCPSWLPVLLPLRHRPSVTCFQRLLARRSAARCKALPVSGGADDDSFGNVYFPRRVSTHARLPLRILPRVLRRFTRPRSTARNPRKGASRL